MGKFEGVLICTDLDGTLYRNDKTISPENQEAIAYFKAEGGYFTFVTGRMPYYSREAYDSVQPNVPFGCINGGGLFDGARNEYVWTKQLPGAYVELVACVDSLFHNVGIQVCGFDRTYFAKENEVMVRFRQATGIPNYTCDYRKVSDPAGKILFGTDLEEEILGMERALRTHPLSGSFDFIRSERTLFEILPKGVHKGLALNKLTEYLHIDPRMTIAIGDYDNDVGMFREAGFGIAVANASPAALAASDRVTVTNEAHAIACVIQELENGLFRPEYAKLGITLQ